MKISCHADYAPLPKSATDRIIQFDRDHGFGPGGLLANRNRFYLYLTQRKADIQVRCVAVKAPDKYSAPIAKEVTRTSVDDPWIHVRDIGFITVCGYIVDWTPNGFGPKQPWSYGRSWGAEPYSIRGMWKINAPVVNPELLKRTRRFRWSDWKPENGHILDYLKVYTAHPEIELLSKAGLNHMCTKVSMLQRLQKNADFRRYFMKNLELIKTQKTSVAAIYKAYAKKCTIEFAETLIKARLNFKGHKLPAEICPLKALGYIAEQKVTRTDYTAYIRDCQKLGMKLADTKVSFPKNFKTRNAEVFAEAAATRRKEKAEELQRTNKKIAEIATEWSWLERKNKRSRYTVVIPRTAADLASEGKAMSNCLVNHSYAEIIERGDVLIFFVRETSAPEKAFIAVEYSIRRQQITQCYGHKNSRPSDAAAEFVKSLMIKQISARV